MNALCDRRVSILDSCEEDLVLSVTVQTGRLGDFSFRRVSHCLKARARGNIRNAAVGCEDSSDRWCVLAEAVNDDVATIGVLLVRRRSVVSIDTTEVRLVRWETASPGHRMRRRRSIHAMRHVMRLRLRRKRLHVRARIRLHGRVGVDVRMGMSIDARAGRRSGRN